MRYRNRKTTPKVAGGKPLRKNNHELTPNYWNTSQKEVVIDQKKPGKGYKHFLKKRDILDFISIIPNWEELSEGLDAIVLDEFDDCDGWYNYSGVIGISAWEKDKDIEVTPSYFKEHQKLFDRLGVLYQKVENHYFCEFNEDQIKAFQLLHILLHELGHHHDRIKTKSKKTTPHGEDYAENYAFEWEEKMWIAYQEKFEVVL